MHSNPSIDEAQRTAVRVKLLEDGAQLPAYTRPGDAGLDLRSVETFDLAPFERKCVRTGFSLEIPEGFAGFVLPRSGLAAAHGISIVNAPGLVDCTYRGEVKVTLVNLDANEAFHVAAGDRIAQLVVLPVPYVTVVEADFLSGTDRGTSGFGSSGVS